MEVAAAVIGVLATALFAFVAYRYRSVITFQLSSISEDLQITEGTIGVADNTGLGTRLTFERLVLKNRGFLAPDNVKLHLEHTPPILKARVAGTSSLSKGAIKLSHDDGRLEILLEHFPQREEVTIELIYLGYGGGEWREVRGTGGRYKVMKEHLLKARRQGMLWGILIGLILFVAPMVAGIDFR